MADEGAVKQYVGLLHDEAVKLAESEGREVVDRSPRFGRRRAHHTPNRVNILLDDSAAVVRADLG